MESPTLTHPHPRGDHADPDRLPFSHLDYPSNFTDSIALRYDYKNNNGMQANAMEFLSLIHIEILGTMQIRIVLPPQES